MIEDIEYEIYIGLGAIPEKDLGEYESNFAASIIKHYERCWLKPDGEWREGVGSVLTNRQRDTAREIINKHKRENKSLRFDQ